jgi:hypothetical protein
VLESVLRQTLSKVKRLLQYSPTVIWSGNGYHIYIPIDVPAVLEHIKELSFTNQASTKFIRFAERYLSSGKSDHAHNISVSINNCMLRIPGSINSHLKGFYTNSNNHHRSVVKVVKRPSEAKRPHINLLMGSFYAHLTQEQIDESRYRQAVMATQYMPVHDNANKHNCSWIEKLLETPISDHRKNCIWRILAPYLISIRKLSYDQAFVIISDWLDKCSKVHKLDFNYKLKIKQDLNNAIKTGYFPTGLYKLNSMTPECYNFLRKNGVI